MSIMSMDPSEFDESEQIFHCHFDSFEFDSWREDDLLNLSNFDSDGDAYFNRLGQPSPDQNRSQLHTVLVDCSEFDAIPVNVRCTKCQVLMKEDSNGLTVCSKCSSTKESKRNSKAARARSQRSCKTNQNNVNNVQSINKPYQCKYCDEYFSGISSLLDHVKTHSSVRCEICSRSFYSEAELKAHCKSHSGTCAPRKRRRTSCEPTMSAKYDSNTAAGETSSNNVAQLEADTDGALRTCSMCSTMYCEKSLHICMAGTDSVTEAFEETTTDDAISISGYDDLLSQYTCAYCNKTFDRVSEFNAHVPTHDVLHRFQCKFCDRMFPRSFLLLRHVETMHEFT